MTKITVKATPGRTVPLSASCVRSDGGPRSITADQGAVELELRDLVAVQYVRRSIKRGDLVDVGAAPATRPTPAPARKE